MIVPVVVTFNSLCVDSVVKVPSHALVLCCAVLSRHHHMGTTAPQSSSGNMSDDSTAVPLSRAVLWNTAILAELTNVMSCGLYLYTRYFNTQLYQIEQVRNATINKQWLQYYTLIANFQQ